MQESALPAAELLEIPTRAPETLAILVGIAFIVNGAGMLGLGWAMHSVRAEARI